MNWFSIIVLFGVLQGIILLFAIYRLKKGNRKANKILTGYIFIIVLTLLGRFFYKYEPVTILYFKILYIGDLIIFLFGPMLYFYLLALFDIKPHFKINFRVHLIPVAVFIALVMPFVLADRENLILMLNKYDFFFTIIEVTAILQNLFYLFLNGILLNKYLEKISAEYSALPQINFYKTILFFASVGIFFWIISFILRLIDPASSGDYIGYQLVWVALSGSVISLGYYTLRNPEALWNIDVQKKYESKPSGLDNIEELSLKLEAVMKEDKPYLKPKLTISDLSQITGINIHLLSRIINEKYSKNFFEFVNYFRIEEFKSQVNNEENKNLTFLAIAYQVGFNSKTTFNTAFKKIVNKTPREYLKLNTISQ